MKKEFNVGDLLVTGNRTIQYISEVFKVYGYYAVVLIEPNSREMYKTHYSDLLERGIEQGIIIHYPATREKQ